MNKLPWLSYSQIFVYLLCKWRWAMQYVWRLVPRVEREKLDLGSAGHAGINSALKGDYVTSGVEKWEEGKRKALKELTDEEEEGISVIAIEAVGIAERAIREFERAGYGNFVHSKFGPLTEVKLTKPLLSTAWAGFKGFVDWIAVEKASGYLWLVDFKIRESFTSVDAEEFNSQAPMYAHLIHHGDASLKVGEEEISDKLGLNIAGSISWQIKNSIPRDPKLNKPDKFGNKKMSRQQILTTWERYRDALIREGIDPKEYEEEMKPKLDGVEWFRMSRAYRNPVEVDAVWEKIVLPLSGEIPFAREAVLQGKEPIRSMGFMNCNSCQYQMLCMESLRGGDVEFIKRMNYVTMEKGKEEEKPEPTAFDVPELVD